MIISINKKKKPGKITAKSLENAAIHYLSRFASSAGGFRKVMMRKVERAARHRGGNRHDIEEGARLVDGLVLRFMENGLLNDHALALALANDLCRQGRSTRAIKAKLAQKRLTAEIIEAAVASLKKDTKHPDLAAAIVLARKRRLGPYRKDGERQPMREKDLAALARAGFDYHLAVKVIGAESIKDLEELEP